MLESSSGVAGDGSGCLCGDCSPLDTLLGSGEKLMEFPRFSVLRCLVSLPFRPDGVDFLDILASGVPADFRQPSRTAGAIHVKEHFTQSGGSLHVMNSSAKKLGGAMFQGTASGCG